jgi:esterase/lipase superfamily enzyme
MPEVRHCGAGFAAVAAVLVLAAISSAQIPSNRFLLAVTATDERGGKIEGAEVRFDDVLLGITDANGQYYLARKPMPGGSRELTVGLPGYKTFSRSVTLPTEREPGLTLTVRLAREPLMISDRMLERRSAATPKAPNYEIVPIFYVTDRQDTQSSDPVERYADERSHSESISHGICEVSIPKTHVAGERETPSWLRFEYHADPNKHIMLQSVQPLATDPFYQKLGARLNASGTREVVVFIHGFKISFEGAARQAAQLAVDLNFDGAPILYSWPSKNSLLSYTEDENTVQWTTFHLRQFLDELAARTNASKIHVVAHSMGNRALASALEVMAAKRRPRAKPLFSQLILAAPDIDGDTLRMFAREFRTLAKRITLYASKNDDALLVSKFIHGGSRAGENGKYLLVAQGVDTIDASSVRTDFLGHRYIANSSTILDDVRKILTKEAPPEARNLLPALFENFKYWIIPSKG